MKALNGRFLYILAAVLALLIVVAWYFFLLAPKRSEVADLTTQVETAQASLNAEQQKLVRYQSYKKSAPQSRTEIVRLGKMLPESEGIPSLIVDLTKTASAAGVTLNGITRGSTAPGAPFGVQAVSVEVSGRFFDVEDFLHRIESYVAWRNEAVRVTGRLLQVTTLSVQLGDGAAEASTSTSPLLTVSLGIDAYLWGGQAAPTTTTQTTAGDGS